MNEKDRPDGQRLGAGGNENGNDLLSKSRIERLNRLNRCFVERILPEIFSVEEDLNQKEFWNKIEIQHDEALESGKPNIREVSFYFIPEKADYNALDERMKIKAYLARFKAERDIRKIRFSMVFPARLSNREEGDSLWNIEQIDRKTVDDFLERFVKGAVSAYSSDHILM